MSIVNSDTQSSADLGCQNYLRLNGTESNVQLESSDVHSNNVNCGENEEVLDEEDLSSDDADSGNLTIDDGNIEVVSTSEPPEGFVGYKYKRILKSNALMITNDPLPEGWIMASHSTGFPLYYHKKTRVVTWSRPYCLLSGRLSKHHVPQQSIPCFNFSNTDIELGQSKDGYSYIEDQRSVGDNTNKLSSGLDQETKDEGLRSDSQLKVILHDRKEVNLSNEVLNEYLEKRFAFETLKIPQFRKWSQRRDFNRSLKRKRLEEAVKDNADEKEHMVSAAKLITLTVEQEDEGGGSSKKKKFVLNTAGKSMICVLHEYAQRVLKIQPQYMFSIREDSVEPFEAKIRLNNKDYGKATAINKKTAKNKAALATLEMLIPGFKGQVNSDQGQANLKYFDDVSVTDSRVHELCMHTGQLLPYHLLTECLKRHQGIADANISYDVKQGKKRSLNYTMTCGKHQVAGYAKNKKSGKQLAAQQILQLLHPEVKTWSELIVMYGTPIAQDRAKRKLEEQEIFDLKQKKSRTDDTVDEGMISRNSFERPSMEPNPELLDKLREMMFKLREERDKRQVTKDILASSGRKTPMTAAIAAGRGLITSAGSSSSNPKLY